MAKATRKSSKGITLSAGAQAFDKALDSETPAIVAETTETVETAENGPVSETVDVPAEGFQLPATDIAPATEPTGEETPAEPVRRRHMTNIVKGMRVNGIGVPAINGKCHEAWKMFDALTYYEGEGDDAKLHTPALGDGLIKGAELGLNPGNIKVEYPRWRKFNGFAAVTRRATATAPVAPVETAPADADQEKEGADAE